MSKFGDLKNARNRTAQPAETEAQPAAPPSPAPALAPPKPLGPGSRGGKRDNPAYTQGTVYLPAELLHKVKGRLHEERGAGGKGRDLSDLVAELLSAWLTSA